ncbi:hypothetical protein [uncultured Proteiniphilum sp.]|uniref:hypothetical protein n=1 Tax=uncultured Proteiniphilum sp. TaxID=497637 RepID=UPI002636F4B4|nr:hypothetical protein [uncultured Proteiniphilum sp.]
MIGVIKGDIIASRKLTDQDKWLLPLKNLLAQWGKTPEQWELVWGDFFQVEFEDPEEALRKALAIKVLIKKIAPLNERKKISTIDVRIGIGIGEKTYSGVKISESNGSAFIHAGERFDALKKEKITMGIKSPWSLFDEEINLYLKLAGTFMDKWTISSAELIHAVLQNNTYTQEEIGKLLGIKQSGVSGRWNRANVEEIMEVEKMYRKKIKKLLS